MVLAGGLRVIYSRVLLDALAWAGLVYAAWTPISNVENAVALIMAAALTLATCGLTSRWTVTFPMAPFILLQMLRRSAENIQDSNLLCYVSIMLMVISIGLSVLFPPLQIPAAQAGGPYAVGAVNFFLPLPKKNDTTANGAALEHTHVQARLLYPTNPTKSTFGSANRVPYMPPSIAIEFLKESMKVAGPAPLKTFDWLMHHWLLAELPIQTHAPLLDAAEKSTLPVVVYSHGLMGNADLYSYQTLSIASQGMLVLVVNHLDGSAPVAEKHDGSRVMYDYDIIELWKDKKYTEYAGKWSFAV
jgi:platelet-activating factor acetylhydrolase